MKIFKNLFLNNKEKIINEECFNEVIDQYLEIGKIVKEARIKKNISIEELSRISKIPKYVLISIENNLENHRPKYPFIRSILFKLEDCLSIRKNTLVDLSFNNSESSKKQKSILVNKFDLINTWEGTILYFLLLISIIFILNKYFISNVGIIEIQNIEQELIKNKISK